MAVARPPLPDLSVDAAVEARWIGEAVRKREQQRAVRADLSYVIDTLA